MQNFLSQPPIKMASDQVAASAVGDERQRVSEWRVNAERAMMRNEDDVTAELMQDDDEENVHKLMVGLSLFVLVVAIVYRMGVGLSTGKISPP